MPVMQIHDAIEKLKSGASLTRTEAGRVMDRLLSGGVPDADIALLLAHLRDKSESLDEMVGFAEAMRAHARAQLEAAGVRAEFLEGPLLDTCGTGGDNKGTFNVSTVTAIVAAAAGVRVAKHGNRSISSRSGSADVLEALGVAIELPLETIPACLEQVGMVFLFAPHLHAAMKHVMAARRSLKTRTIFNLLGPLTNPLGASVQLAGVYDRDRTETVARALASLGTVRALVVTSHDGMDEISISSLTQVSESRNGTVRTRHLEPEEFRVKRAPLEAISGGGATENARVITQILAGEPGPYREMTLANSSAAIVVAGLAADFAEGTEKARQAIDSGTAARTLKALVDFTRKHHS